MLLDPDSATLHHDYCDPFCKVLLATFGSVVYAEVVVRAIASASEASLEGCTVSDSWEVYDRTPGNDDDVDGTLRADTVVFAGVRVFDTSNLKSALIEAAKDQAVSLFDEGSHFDGEITLWVDDDQEDDVQILRYDRLWD